MKKYTLIITALVIIISACAANTSNSDQARQALTDFFSRLSNGNYAQAVELYGGSYETLVSSNPDLNTEDKVALWQNGCKINGLQCLTVRTAQLNQQSGDIFVFNVEFNNADGTLFVRGPCCGADETQSPPVSSFQVRVQRTSQGKFLVLDMPVYVP